MSKLRLNVLAAHPVAPSAGKVDIYQHADDRKIYSIDDLGKITAFEKGIGASVADVAIVANTNNTLLVSDFIPANTIQVGDIIKVEIDGTFTQATASTASSVRVHFGPLGTNADPIILTSALASGVGTSAARVTVDSTFRTVGTSGTISGRLICDQHTNAIVGLAIAASIINLMTTTTAPNTTVKNKITISILTAAAGVTGTVRRCTIKIMK